MIIKDKKIAPYQIHCDGSNYTVVEKTDKKDKDGNKIFKTIAYCSSTENALKKICRLLVDDTEKTYSLKQYFKEFTEHINKIENIVYKKKRKK